MKIIHYGDIEPTVFSEPAKGVRARVLIGKADGAENFCMRLFELPPGTNSPRHSHEWEHEIFIHSGKGEVLRKGQWVGVTPGTAIFIPGHEEHQVRCAGDEPLVFLCLIPSGPPEL